MTSSESEHFVPEPLPDATEALRRAVRYGSFGVLALAAAGVLVGGLAAGLPGVWGALLGAAVGGGFVLITGVTVLASAKLPPTTAMVVVLGSWLVKMAVALIVLGLLGSQTFYDRTTFAVVTVGALVLVLGAEVWGILKSKMLYVDEKPSDPH